MPSRKTVESFVSLVEAGKYDLAIENYYTEDASMQENLDAPRKGRGRLVEHERHTMGLFKEIKAKSAGPVFVEGDRVIIRWLFEFAGLGGGTRKLDELAYQRWDGEKIAEERFYYDPAQLRG